MPGDRLVPCPSSSTLHGVNWRCEHLVPAGATHHDPDRHYAVIPGFPDERIEW